jgi:excisionase family DNA binding protein
MALFFTAYTLEKIYTPEQVANYLQVHHLTVLRLIKAKKLIALKIGRIYRISESSLNKFISKKI